MRRVNGYEPKIRDFRGSEILKSFARNKVSNLKMDTDYTEKNPFVDGAANPGYDETGEINEMDRFPSSSSRRGSEDTTFRSSHSKTYGETSFIEGEDEHTPLLGEEEKRAKALAKKRAEEDEKNKTKLGLKSKENSLK